MQHHVFFIFFEALLGYLGQDVLLDGLHVLELQDVLVLVDLNQNVLGLEFPQLRLG